MKKIIAIYSIFLIFHGSYAQRIISGKIVDDNKSPLPGVSILIKNSQRGTYSGEKGDYSISANSSDTILFSMVGMISQQVYVGNTDSFNIQLHTEVTGLGEVVVVGYGSQRVRDLTAPIVTVKSDMISNQTTTNPIQALQGKISGVQIIYKSGAPGDSSTVRIRGTGSIGDYANPLFIVDGVYVDNINFLSNNDIEDVTILKDASAAAIYGVRAANGVVLITTKKGVSGRPPTITYDGSASLQIPLNTFKMANTSEYVTLRNEANQNTDKYIPLTVQKYHGADTRWYNELLRIAVMQNQSLDISGASDKSHYSFGINYLYQNGIMKAINSYNRLNVRGNTDFQISDHAKVGFSAILSNYNRTNPDNNAFFQAFLNPPIYNVYDNSNSTAYPVRFGTPQSAGLGNEFGNPLAFAYYNDNRESGYTLIPSMFLELTFLKKMLTFRSQFNENLDYNITNSYTPQYFVGGSQGQNQSTLDKTFRDNSKQIIDNILTFSSSANVQHELTFMIGNSIRIERSSYMTGDAVNVPGLDEQSKYLINGSFNNRNNSDGGYVYDGLSYFSRFTYDLNQKYLVTLTFRADGSSKYQQKWGYFPSAGLGWILTEENFMKNQQLFQYLKLRASWGLLGNDNVPANSVLISGSTGAQSSGIFNNVLINGIGAQTVYQNYLKWEIVNEYDLGLDFKILKNVNGNLDLYRRITNNVVFSAPIASGGGTVSLLGNNGSVRNEGIELSLKWDHNVKENLNFSLGGNIALLDNKVLSITGYGSNGYIPGAEINGVFATRAVVGKPIGSFYGYKVTGVYQSLKEIYQDPVAPAWALPGYLKYADVNGDGKIDQNDLTYLGSPIPWLMGGIDFSLNYKNLDFFISLQGQYGNKVLNQKRMNKSVFPASNYDLNFYDNRWHGEGTSDTYPSAEAMANSNIQTPNSFFVENAAFIRIETVQLGYTLSTFTVLKSAMPKLRFYVSAQKPYTYTKYNGFSPEIGGSTPNEMGIDNTVYPMQSIYSIGMKAIF